MYILVNKSKTIHVADGALLLIYPIHVAAMINKKRGTEGKFTRHYVTSLLLHVPVT